ncbi:MAG: SDR family oxidoreductase [Lachnospiraceae bacterium]|nr:SDR family oxidoreductase [Lachnospiraceae bacterium]
MLKGKNAIITGARTGIGRATVEKLASEGVNIWACAHRENEAFKSDMEQLSRMYGVWIKPVYFDLEDEAAVKAAVKNVLQEKKQVDILVNNAGVFPPLSLFTMTSIARMRSVFEVNFFSQALISQLVSKIMMRYQTGVIVNLVSVAGLDGDVGVTAYGASKAALALSTKVWAKEFAPYGIRVNAVAPGLIDTHLNDHLEEGAKEALISKSGLGRLGRADEVAEAIAYLVSDKASFISGQIIRVDGGM